MQGGTMSDVKKAHIVGCGTVTLIGSILSVVIWKTLLPFEDLYYYGRKLGSVIEQVLSAVKRHDTIR
jgi:hypothetical protein